MILITGGSGYVGSHITRRLAQDGEAVRVLVRDSARYKREARLGGLSIDVVEGDVTVPESLQDAFDGVDAVVHTVAIAIEKGGKSYAEVNYQGTVHAVEASKAAGVKRFVNMSQLGAAPDLPYRFLASKGRAQEYVAHSGLEWTAFRPSVIWGPEDEFANTFAKLLPFTPLIFPIIGDESTTFEPVWVEDVVTCFLKAIRDQGTIGKEYELGGPEVLTLEEIELRTLKAVGARRSMVRFPMPVLRLIVKLMETFLPAPPVTSSLLELLAVSNVTQSNALSQFVSEPRSFTSENAREYMVQFRARDTLAQFLGRA